MEYIFLRSLFTMYRFSPLFYYTWKNDEICVLKLLFFLEKKVILETIGGQKKGGDNRDVVEIYTIRTEEVVVNVQA